MKNITDDIVVDFNAEISFDSAINEIGRHGDTVADEPEVGRDAVTTARENQRASLPWRSAQFSSSTLHSELSDYPQPARTSQIRGRRQSTLTDDNRLSLGPGDTAISWNNYDEEMALPETAPELPEESFSLDEGIRVTEFSLSTHLIPVDSRDSTMEKDTLGFLNYLYATTSERSRDTLDFDELLSERKTKIAAADAFYRVLVLVTKNLVSVSQTAPFDSIEIVVPN